MLFFFPFCWQRVSNPPHKQRRFGVFSCHKNTAQSSKSWIFDFIPVESRRPPTPQKLIHFKNILGRFPLNPRIFHSVKCLGLPIKNRALIFSFFFFFFFFFFAFQPLQITLVAPSRNFGRGAPGKSSFVGGQNPLSRVFVSGRCGLARCQRFLKLTTQRKGSLGLLILSQRFKTMSITGTIL